MNPADRKKALDGGWAWVIVLVSFMAQLLAYGSPQSVGVLYTEWLSAFHQTKGLTAWVGSLVSGVGLIASPVCSACVISFGARPVTLFSGVMVSGGLMLSAFTPNVQFLIFSYGIVVGLGCGLVYAATVTITCQYFDKRRGLALGIVTTGTSVGGFVYASVQVELIEAFGLDWCLLIIGALALNIVACAGLMRPLSPPGYYLQRRAELERSVQKLLPPLPCPAEKASGVGREVQLSRDGRTLMEMLKKKQQQIYVGFLHHRIFSSFCLSLFLFTLGSSPPVLFMEDVAQSEGLADGPSAVPLVSVVALSAGLGKLLLGLLCDLRWISSLFLYAVTLLGSAVALLFIPCCNSYAGLQALSAIMGFFSGNWSITPYITTDIVGIERLPQAYGILMVFGGFGSMLGPPVVGWLYDWTQSYALAFHISGSCVLLGSLGLFLTSMPFCNKTEATDSEVPAVVHCDTVSSEA